MPKTAHEALLRNLGNNDGGYKFWRHKRSKICSELTLTLTHTMPLTLAPREQSDLGWPRVTQGERWVSASRLARTLTLVRWPQMGALPHVILGPSCTTASSRP